VAQLSTLGVKATLMDLTKTKLIQMIEAFIVGESRSRDFVSQMEGEFAANGLDDDERFSDLQYALAMFGAGSREDDEKMLADECRYALKLLR
jgi:hypothetical protein